MKDTRDEYEPLSFGVTRAVVGDHAQPRKTEPQHFGNGLGEQRRRSLPDVRRPGKHADAAVEIELQMDDRMRLASPVHGLRRPARVVRAGHAKAAAPRQLAPALAPARSGFDAIETLGQAIRVDLQVVDRPVRHGQQIGAANREGVEARFVRHAVEQRFERMAHVDRAVAAHRAVRRCVRVDTQAVVPAGRDAVQRVQQCAGIEDRDQSIAGVGAATLHDLAIDRRDRACFRQSDLEPHVGFGAATMREEALLAGQFELDRASRGAREKRRDDLEIERLGAMTKPAADKRLDDADQRLVHAETTGERQVHVIRHLRHRLHRETPALGVVLRERGIGLHHRLVDFGIVIARLAHDIGACHCAIDVAEYVVDRALDIAGLVVMERHGVSRLRRADVEAGRQRLQLDFDRAQCGARGSRVIRGNGGNRLAAIAHPLARQRKLVLRDGDHPIGNGAVVSGDDCAHSGQRACTGGIDAKNSRVRDRAAQNRADERIAAFDVGSETRAAGDLLDAIDQRLAHADRAIRPHERTGPVRHRDSPRSQPWLADSLRASAAACTDSMIFT